MELKKIGILSLGKISALFGLIIGLLLGIFSIIYAKIILSGYPEIAQQLNIAQVPGAKEIILSIVMSGIVYFLVGIITAVIYNLLAGWIGGIKLEFAEKKK